MHKDKNTIGKIVRGGFFADRRTHIMSGVGIISAVAAYLVGDSDIFVMLQAIFTLGGIYFLRKTNDTKGQKNGTGS
ncbi:hypothetical protein HDR61_00120 [bacterium]|nr:hypothetical protein [bacterium]